MDVSRVIESEYVVLDVETNGLSSLGDDLLSISIFQPDTERVFNRFLPLELNKDVYTTHINGIKKEDLKNATALTQQEVDDLITEFDLERRTILIYGTIDEKFIKNYFKRKQLNGFEKLRFFNFKRNVLSSRFSRGSVTKDNLCRVYGIANVQEKHTGVNDCLLEWELFKRMDNQKLLITGRDVFEFNEEYIVPASFINTYPNIKYHLTNLPYILCNSIELERFEVVGKNLKKFPTNFNGMVIEHLINSMLYVEKVDSSDFLIKNKSKLKYIGKMPSIFDEILLDFRPDGTVRAVHEKDKKAEEELNQFVESLKKELYPLVNYIAQDVFLGEKVFSQELVVHQNENILALCDLSSKNTVLEIKTYSNLDINKFKEQLYYQSNGRSCFVLQIDWAQLPKKIEFVVSKVDFVICEAPPSSYAERYRQKVSKLSDGVIEIRDYISSKEKVTAKCSQCQNEWVIRADRLLSKPFCPYCRGDLFKDIKKATRKPIITTKERKE